MAPGSCSGNGDGGDHYGNRLCKQSPSKVCDRVRFDIDGLHRGVSFVSIMMTTLIYKELQIILALHWGSQEAYNGIQLEISSWRCLSIYGITAQHPYNNKHPRYITRMPFSGLAAAPSSSIICNTPRHRRTGQLALLLLAPPRLFPM